MYKEYQCSQCFSNNVEGKAWVSLNPLGRKIDFSPIESNDTNDYWCPECSEHTEIIEQIIYEIDDTIKFQDPETEKIDTYKIKEIKTIDGDYSIYLIANEYSEAEIYKFEIIPI